MPTTRARYQVTETPQVAHALDLAAQHWPDEPRSKLLLHLIRTGSAVLEQESSDASRDQLEAIASSSGKYIDAFAGDYLAELRHDWPHDWPHDWLQ